MQASQVTAPSRAPSSNSQKRNGGWDSIRAKAVTPPWGGAARTAPRPGARRRQHPRATSGTHGRVLWGAPPRKGCDSTNVGKAVGLRVRIRRRHSRCLSARERLAGGSEAGAGRPVAVTKRVGQPQQGETGHPRWGRGQGGTSAFRAPERGPERGHDPELGAAGGEGQRGGRRAPRARGLARV